MPCAETRLAKPADTETTRHSYTTPGTCKVGHRAWKEAFFLDNRTEVTGLRTLDEMDKKITPCEVSSSNPQCVTEAMAPCVPGRLQRLDGDGGVGSFVGRLLVDGTRRRQDDNVADPREPHFDVCIRRSLPRLAFLCLI